MPKKFGKPSPAVSQLNKDQKKKQKDFEERVGKMKPELIEICRKHKVDIVGAMEYRSNGTFPIIVYIDAKDKYEHKAEPPKEKPKGLVV